jgi:hypothetical protein
MKIRYIPFVALALSLATASALAQVAVLPKAHVANLIRNVEDGVDKFRDYLKRNGEDARSRANEAQASGATNRRTRRNPQNTEARKQQATNTKDELDDALGDLNRSTNRLRRKFDATDTWMETKGQVERVMDDARRINQVMVRGKYGTQTERFWATLRAAINDLARVYRVPPMGV